MLTLMVGMGTAINQPAWQASVRLQVGKADLPWRWRARQRHVRQPRAQRRAGAGR
jgi:hypothetical protein